MLLRLKGPGRRWLLAAGCLLVGCSHVRQGPGWTRDVDAYREADIALFFARDEPEVAQTLERREQFASELLRAPAPDRGAVRAVLASGGMAEREAALVFAIVHGWNDDEVLGAVLDRYTESTTFFSRYYAARLLVLSGPEKVARWSDRIARAMLMESDERVRLGWLPLVHSMKRGTAGDVCRAYMMTGSPILQRATYAVSVAVGADFAGELRRSLREAGAASALRTLDLFDSVYIPRMQADAEKRLETERRQLEQRGSERPERPEPMK